MGGSNSFVTLKYIQAFHCLGSDCPDHCCVSWGVIIDQENLCQLQQVYPQGLLESRIAFGDDAGLPPGFGMIRMAEDGLCPFLDGNDGLCTIHKCYGEGLLSKTCRTYPRLVNLINDRIELGLSISCPEAARCCLTEDDAVRRVEPPQVELEALEGMAFDSVGPDDSPYSRYFDRVRERFIELMADERYALGERIFFIYCLARALSDHLYQGVEQVDEKAIDDIFTRFADERYFDTLKSRLDVRKDFVDFPLSVIQRLVLASAIKHDMCADLVMEVFDNYKRESELRKRDYDEVDELLAAFEDVASVYLFRRDRICAVHGDLIERYLVRYCQNYLFSQMFTLKRSPAAYVQDLMVIVATLRFLLFSHPGLNICTVNGDMLSETQLEALVIKVFYKFSRSVEHSGTLLDEVFEGIDPQNLDSIGHFAEIAVF